MKTRTTRRTAAAVGTLLAWLLLAGCSAIHAERGSARDAVFATVNGEPLQVGELRLMMNRTRSEVAARFQEKAGGSGDDLFRLRSIGGEDPLDVWKRTALKALVRAKVEQLEAVREGVLADAGYSAFLKRLAAENRERADAVAHRQVVYGPTAFTEDTYYDYEFTNAHERLKAKLAASRPAVTERELRAYYDERKRELYGLEERIKVGKIVISYVDSDGRVSDKLRGEAERRIKEAAARLEQGEDFAKLSGELSTGPEAADGGVQLFDSETASTDQRYRPELLEAARKLQPGQASGVLEFDNAFYLIKCLERADGGVRAYEDVKEDARSRLLEAKFAEWLDAEVSRAQVQLVPAQWERIG